MSCSNCSGKLWVCENHGDRPWDEKLPNGCECGAGMPCGICNPCDRDNPPRHQEGFTVICEAN